MAETHIPFAIPSQQKQSNEPPSPPDLDYMDENADTLIQHLVEAARGVALCLQSLSEKSDLRDADSILGGLASVLKIAALYYELHGCLVCQRKEEVHEGHGMCHTCYYRFVHRLKAIREAIR